MDQTETGSGVAGAKREPRVSVIVPVWNDADRLRRCVEALNAQTLPADDFEIIVVDNGSTDNSYEVASSFARTIALKEELPGSYNARNRGLSVARGRYIAFTDSDCVPTPNWLEHAVGLAQGDSGIGVVAGQIDLFSENENTLTVCADYQRIFSFNQRLNATINVSTTANWLGPRAAIDEGGQFDGLAKSGEDFGLARRIAARGWRIVYSPDSIVRHPVRGTISEIAAKRRRVLGGRWQQSTSRLRFLQLSFGRLINCARSYRSVLRYRNLSWARKLMVLGLITRLLIISQFELIRLAANGEPLR